MPQPLETYMITLTKPDQAALQMIARALCAWAAIESVRASDEHVARNYLASGQDPNLLWEQLHDAEEYEDILSQLRVLPCDVVEALGKEAPYLSDEAISESERAAAFESARRAVAARDTAKPAPKVAALSAAWGAARAVETAALWTWAELARADHTSPQAAAALVAWENAVAMMLAAGGAWLAETAVPEDSGAPLAALT